jgi:lipoprotein-anchoring transpeptidase ErfK/SrfK
LNGQRKLQLVAHRRGKPVTPRVLLAGNVALALLVWSAHRADAAFMFDWSRPGGYPYQAYPYRASPYRASPYRPSPYAVRPRRTNGPAHHRHTGPANADKAEKHVSEAPPKEPLQIVVSIAEQRVSLYGDGALVARSAVSTGMRGHPTPTGIFSVIQKHKWHHSNIYSGAPMPYMQRITWSGVALHAGVLPGYPASHGCIRLRNEFAVRLWHSTHIGTRVIVARRDVAPVEISHPKLFAPKADVAAASPADRAAPAAGAGIVKTADLVAAEADSTKASDAVNPPAAAPATPPPPRKPISIFISRKQGKLFVRQGFNPLFEAEVKFDDPERPLGTHLFTAMERNGASMRWTVISMPEAPPTSGERHARADRKGSHKKAEQPDAASAAPSSLDRARAALDRLDIPQDAVERISELLVPQSSLIISDNALSGETGTDTDFIVLAH